MRMSDAPRLASVADFMPAEMPPGTQEMTDRKYDAWLKRRGLPKYEVPYMTRAQRSKANLSTSPVLIEDRKQLNSNDNGRRVGPQKSRTTRGPKSVRQGRSTT